MKLLIIEDNDLKYRRVLTSLETTGPHKVERARNLRTALANLRHGGHEMVLLDMTFEVLDNRSQSATLQALAGLQVMQYMRRVGIKLPVVVVTQHTSFHQPGSPTISTISELNEVLRTTFADMYLGYVYMTDGNDWQGELNNLVLQVSNG